MKKFGLKRGIALLLLVIFCIFSVCSCNKNRSYDEQEVLSAAESLLSKVGTLNTVYFGEGINYLSERVGEGSYCEADPIHLNALGFTTLTELELLTLEVFSDGCAENIIRTKLEPITVDGQIIELARYYQDYDVESGEETVIMVNKNLKSVFDDRMVFDYSTLKVLGSEGERVLLEIDVTVKNKDGLTKVIKQSVTLIEESDGWRLDGYVIANYRE